MHKGLTFLCFLSTEGLIANDKSPILLLRIPSFSRRIGMTSPFFLFHFIPMSSWAKCNEGKDPVNNKWGFIIFIKYHFYAFYFLKKSCVMIDIKNLIPKNDSILSIDVHFFDCPKKRNQRKGIFFKELVTCYSRHYHSLQAESVTCETDLFLPSIHYSVKNGGTAFEFCLYP